MAVTEKNTDLIRHTIEKSQYITIRNTQATLKIGVKGINAILHKKTVSFVLGGFTQLNVSSKRRQCEIM